MMIFSTGPILIILLLDYQALKDESPQIIMNEYYIQAKMNYVDKLYWDDIHSAIDLQTRNQKILLINLKKHLKIEPINESRQKILERDLRYIKITMNITNLDVVNKKFDDFIDYMSRSSTENRKRCLERHFLINKEKIY